ncbi:MAG: hypothetical protein HC805_01170 [Alkalinema sp. RL_2_19]|nr:hypothetical protein [Alkalinema sp. RL_2_19]
MTITRVVQDGAEFFTIDATGESGVSISGAAKLAGVRRQSLTTLIQNVAAGKTRSKCLEPFTGKDLRVQFSFARVDSYTQIVWLPSDFLAALLEYYAYESPRKTREALFAFRKFAKMGVDRWIQSITGWVDPQTIPVEPPPLPDLKLPRYALDILQNPNILSTNGYRLYLQLHDADIRNLRLTAADVCKTLKITLPTYHKALNLLDHLSLLPSWVVTKKRRQPERLVRDWLREQIGGKRKPLAPMDRLTC